MNSPTKTCKTMLHVALGALCLLALDGALASDASAQTPSRTAPVHELDGTIVNGEADGPGAFYVLERGRSSEPPRELRRSFVRAIVESVRSEPF